MPRDLGDSVADRADPATTIEFGCRRGVRVALIGDLIASIGLFMGDVIGPDAHDGRDSIQSSAERARQRSVLVIIMKYRDPRIRHETRATAVR
jgi:hypothetical protein